MEIGCRYGSFGCGCREGGVSGTVVRRAREEDRSSWGALWDEHNRMQSHAVTHRNHDVASGVIEARSDRLKFRRRLARILGVLRSLRGQRQRSEEYAK